jgi:stress response protein YsnF
MEQTIIVERRPVNRTATAADLSQDQERVLKVRTIAEEPVVAKAARVVEEVEIGRETTQHEKTIRERVRRTDVEVEQVPDETHPGMAAAQRPEARPQRQRVHPSVCAPDNRSARSRI